MHIKCNEQFSNVLLEGRKHLSCMLHQSHENINEHVQNAEKSFHWQYHGENTELWVVFSIQRRFCRRLWAFRLSLHVSFLTLMAMFFRNFSLQAERLTHITTVRFSTVWWSKSTENNQMTAEPGVTSGWFTTTMYWWTLPQQCRNFWPLTTWLWFPASLFASSGPLLDLLVSENEIAATKVLFPECSWI